MSITVSQLSKQYGPVTALDGVSLTLEGRKIYGLLGRNGAGKSTLMKLMSDRIRPTAGEILVDGKSVHNNTGRIYMMSEDNLYVDSMKVRDIFRWTGEFYGGFDQALADRLCEEFELNPKKKATSLSTGYKSICKLITALCVDADYIFMDEPVLGLDAGHRELFYRSLLETYADRPRMFLLSTHLIEEVAGVIEDVIIIDKGKILRTDSVENLLRSGYNITGAAAAVDDYCRGKEVLGCDTVGGIKTAAVLGRTEVVPTGLTVSPLDLQKLFIRMTEKREGK
ncbi:MAG: ABC transporter ATP-binding protein [Oscillospiraceae bacterium]|nr:ABC transporter ATP-binding protein [Oscillospiraceae bacterium]